MHLRALDALQLWSFVWSKRWVTVRIKVPSTDPCDSRSHCGFSRCHAMNSSNDNCECEGDVVSSAHGIILENEVVPAAFKLHADRLLVRPLECPLIVPPFATGSVCSRFTVPDGHRSTGAPNSVMVQCVAAAPGGVWAQPFVTLEDGCPVAGAIHIARPFYFTDASPPASPRTWWPCCRVHLPAHGQPQHGDERCLCAWRGAVGGGGLDECRDGSEGAPRLRRH
ncbi:surface protease GP63 [Trypanosoma cruzi]|nr:surface protease GP63 [Trypanosoma cruzi]